MEKSATPREYLLMPWLTTAATIDTSNPYQMMKAVAEKSFDRLKTNNPKCIKIRSISK